MSFDEIYQFIIIIFYFLKTQLNNIFKCSLKYFKTITQGKRPTSTFAKYYNTSLINSVSLLLKKSIICISFLSFIIFRTKINIVAEQNRINNLILLTWICIMILISEIILKSFEVKTLQHLEKFLIHNNLRILGCSQMKLRYYVLNFPNQIEDNMCWYVTKSDWR